MKPKVAVVILNFNTKALLEQLLPFVLESSYENTEVWVADNASSDGSLDLVHAKFPQVKTIAIANNLGYAGGYNEALRQISSDYYVLLNSDVEVEQSWLEPLVELAESNSAIASIQPKILDYYKRTHFEYAGASGGMLDKYFYPFCRGRMFEHLEEDKGQYNDTREVFWATGACLFMRAELFHACGGLDEDFFAHMEEIDMCWRLSRMGYKHYVCPDSVVYHMGGGTLASGSERKLFLNYRNNLLMIIKNSRGSLLWNLFSRMTLDGISAIVALLQGKPYVVRAVWNSHMAMYGRLRYWLSKRKKFEKEHKVALFSKSIVWAYFIQGKRTYNELRLKG